MRPALSLYYQNDRDKDLYKFSLMLKEKYKIEGRIASNNNWGKTTIVAYHLNASYYGRIKKKLRLSQEEVQTELLRNNIEYFFVWQNGRKNYSFLSSYREMTNGDLAQLKIYQMRSD